jgi:hypothetical protein
MNKYNLQKSTISIFDKGIAFINASVNMSYVTKLATKYKLEPNQYVF